MFKNQVQILQTNGLTDEEVVRRLEIAGLPQEDIDQLIKLPAKEQIKQETPKQDPLELIADIEAFLESAAKKLESNRQAIQSGVVNDMKVFHIRCREQTNG